MSAVMKPRRHPQRDAAEKRFAEFASALTVSKELGIKYMTAYFWWRAFNGNPVPKRKKPPREYASMHATSAEARAAVSSSDADPADEA